jgi:hypothetical protein
MIASPRRILLLLVAFTIFAASAAMRPDKTSRHSFRVTFGVGDKQPTDWNGRVSVAGGPVESLTGWRFQDKDRVEGPGEWRCRTHIELTPGARYPLTPGKGKPKPAPAPMQPAPVGIHLTVKGAGPVIALTLGQGEIRFRADEIMLGDPKRFLDGRVSVERLPDANALRPAMAGPSQNARQDDYPALWIRYKTGVQSLAWIEYHQEHDRVLFAQRQGFDGDWSEPLEVAGPGDHFRVALAGVHGSALWIVWSSQRAGAWDLYGREFKDGRVGPEVRLTDAHGPNIWHQMTIDSKGRGWLVWQGFRGGHFDILARCVDAAGWHEPIPVSSGEANHWDPVVAADPKEDRVWVGWDTYESGNYQVQVRSLSGGPDSALGKILTPDASDRFSAHLSLACDGAGRLFAAWNESGPEWGKDTGFLYPTTAPTRLYQSRLIRVSCLADDKWMAPAADLNAVLSPELREFNDLPALQGDTEGRMWLTFRHRTCRRPRVDGWAMLGQWNVYATAFVGDRWLLPVELPDSAGANDMRVSSQRDNDGNVYFAYPSDNRRWASPGMLPRNLSISVARLGSAPRPAEVRLAETKPRDIPPKSPSVHPREKSQVALVRDYGIQAGGKTYRIYRGDLHRHTDISGDGVGDGSLMDLYRYGLDAAALDYIMVTDHNMGNDHEYSWWQTQKSNDLYTLPGHFISMYGYERSVPYPNGHRNVIWTRRGHRTLPLPQAANPAQMAADTAKLYAYLRRTEGICTLHTSATDQGTDWKEHDDSVEPFVELYQGYHTSYEAPGAPLTEDATTALVHGPYRPAGFVSRALNKGYRLGFQASSDHISTHVSYACILAEEFSRKGLVDAMRRRHTYAATDNIVLDVRMPPAAIMGDEVRTSQPRLLVQAIGTGLIDRVEILRNGDIIHTERRSNWAEILRFQWSDPSPPKGQGTSYYYVRLIQKNGHMAWSSPIWVHNE